MFLTDFHTRKYTGGIVSRVGIFLTVTPGGTPTYDGSHFTENVGNRIPKDIIAASPDPLY